MDLYRCPSPITLGQLRNALEVMASELAGDLLDDSDEQANAIPVEVFDYRTGQPLVLKTIYVEDGVLCLDVERVS